MNALRVIEEANLKFEEATIWYEDQSDGLGLRFMDVVREKLKAIQNYPEHYPKKKGKFREAYVGIFPYIIVYVFYKMENLVVVTSIFHTSKDPKKKYRKRK